LKYSFHGYDIQEKIGSGGMSTVYKGIHQTLGYPVAIKILHPGLAGDTSFIKRFEREAKAASALRCNNIASVIDFGSEDDVYFIVMEFVDGMDLSNVFESIQGSSDQPGAFPVEMALLLLEEVAYGLKEAHENGLIHRDIKPANILIDKRGEVKIADFGLARDTSDLSRPKSLDLTQPGTVLGTPSYMSPEQAAGKADLDARTDIFSLGVMVYQLLTGQKPFFGDTPTAVQEKIINEDPPPLRRESCPLLTAEIESMVDKMLAKDPAKRFATVDHLLRGLKESMESIDSRGTLNRYRRDYLANFAKDPVAFAKELRDKSVTNHLKLGYHFKSQGFTNIDDALREFTYVLSLDPSNKKAANALKELKKRQQEESGQFQNGTDSTTVMPPQGTDPGQTMVMPGMAPATGGKTKKTQVKPPKSGMPKPAGGGGFDFGSLLTGRYRIPVFAGSALVVVVILLWVVLAGRDGPEAPVLQLASDPAGAEIWWRTADESEFVNSGLTTDAVVADLAAGPVAIEIRHEGYVTAATDLELSAGDTIQYATNLERIVLEGSMTVTTTPPGATVGYRPAGSEQEYAEFPGRTPMEVGQLPAGSYELSITLEGHGTVDDTIEVAAGEIVSSDHALSPVLAQGRLAVTSRPTGARVSMRKRGAGQYRYAGTTPHTTDLLEAGNWDVRVELAGHDPAGVRGTVLADSTRRYNFALKKTVVAPQPDGYVSMIISPYGDVYVDGEKRASEEKRTVLALASNKSHQLELRHEQTFSTLRIADVRVTPGDTLNLSRQAFSWGSLAVSANTDCEMMIDGQWFDSRRLLELARIGVGEHEISIRRPGFVADAVTMLAGSDRIELEPINAGENPARFKVTIPEGREIKVRFRMKQQG